MPGGIAEGIAAGSLGWVTGGSLGVSLGGRWAFPRFSLAPVYMSKWFGEHWSIGAVSILVSIAAI
jgi:hypothetical protein